MIITASHTFRGMLDLSANPTLEDLNELEALPFHLTMKSGQVITVDDKFYSLRNIQGAIKAGYITTKLRESSDLVINAQNIKKHIVKIIKQKPD